MVLHAHRAGPGTFPSCVRLYAQSIQYSDIHISINETATIYKQFWNFSHKKQAVFGPKAGKEEWITSHRFLYWPFSVDMLHFCCNKLYAYLFMSSTFGRPGSTTGVWLWNSMSPSGAWPVCWWALWSSALVLPFSSLPKVPDNPYRKWISWSGRRQCQKPGIYCGICSTLFNILIISVKEVS